MKKLIAAVFAAVLLFSFVYAEKNSAQEESSFIEKIVIGQKYISEMKKLIDDYVKSIKEITSNMTAQEKQQFNEMLKESVKEAFQRMKGLIDLLGKEDKEKLDKVIGEFIKKLEAK
ncbi:MAG: hypothetical protein LBU09_04015 [Endomicrobium sp.]|jgi:uncharacterized protein HemX|nr:hypothetical protein [Endomicrobium sp.]